MSAVSPGSAVSAACLALLSVWRYTDGQVGWAIVLAVLALVSLSMGLRSRPDSAAASGRASRRPDGRPAASSAQEEQQRRTWWVIAAAGLVGSVVAVTVFPPLALALSGAGAYAALRARRMRVAS